MYDQWPVGVMEVTQDRGKDENRHARGTRVTRGGGGKQRGRQQGLDRPLCWAASEEAKDKARSKTRKRVVC